MANETKFENIAGITDVISDAISPALQNPVVVAPLIKYEPLPVGTNVKLWRKDGYLVAEEINEVAAQAVDGSEQELTQSTVTATMVKLAATTMLSVEVQQFRGLNLNTMARYIGEAIARDWDDEILALFSSFDNTVTSTTIQTLSDIIQGTYNVRSNTAGVSVGPLVGVFDFKAIMELEIELSSSSAAHLSLPTEIALLQGMSGANGFRGEKGGVWFYQTSGLPTATSDDKALIYDPEICFGGQISERPMVKTRWLGGAGDGTRGFCDEVSGWVFCDVVEWNDAAGCTMSSDT